VHKTVGSAHRYQHITLNVASTPDSLKDCIVTKLQQIVDMQKRKGKLSVQQYVLCVAHIRTHCGSVQQYVLCVAHIRNCRYSSTCCVWRTSETVGTAVHAVCGAHQNTLRFAAHRTVRTQRCSVHCAPKGMSCCLQSFLKNFVS
jgi:hypothetical protein